jgi:hypothetical protein
MIDRRAFSRRGPREGPWAGARLRPGRDVVLVDLSSGGAQVETLVPLLPGSRVVLQLLGGGAACLVSGRVTRCQVHALDKGGGVRYRGAVAFDELLALPPGTTDPCGYVLPTRPDQDHGSNG